MRTIARVKVTYTDGHDGRTVERSFNLDTPNGNASQVVEELKRKLDELQAKDPSRPTMTVGGWTTDHVMSVSDAVKEINRYRA